MASGLFTLKQVNQAIKLDAWSGYEFPNFLEYLVVAAGGGSSAGGGGAGGLLTGNIPVTIGSSYTVTIGAGGASAAGGAANGGDSVFGSITASGGGAGGWRSQGTVQSGGSGGGAAADANTVGGQAVAGQGFPGGSNINAYSKAGGGGGAGGKGADTSGTVDGVGGPGVVCPITGSNIVYAAGGNGTYTAVNVSGGENTGNGAQGQSAYGGSGIVVVAYPGNIQFYTGGVVSYANGKTVHTFRSSGTLTPTTPTRYNVTDVLVPKSLRLDRTRQTYFDRTQPSGATNLKKWTWSAWVKHSSDATGLYDFLLATSGFSILYFAGGLFRIYFTNGTGGAGVNIYTKRLIRDPSAWMHLMVAVDTTDATASNRLRVYINGVEEAYANMNVEANVTQNADLYMNRNQLHQIGREIGTGQYATKQISEVHMVDGLQLTPSYFGYTNPNTGLWSPLKYTGEYGKNGWYLNFSDDSAATATTLGKDYSGNSLNWTPYNFSINKSSTNYDVLTDSPASYGPDSGAGGEIVGNFATWNPLTVSSTYATISNGNLRYTDTTAAGSFQAVCTTLFATSGKYYAEFVTTAVSGANYSNIGICSPPVDLNFYVEKTVTGYQGYGYGATGDKSTNDTYTATGTTYAAGDVISVAVDIDNSKVWFAKNGTWIGSGNPATGANPAYTIVSGRPYGFACNNGSSATSVQIDANFGQRPWTYTAPAGFKALCTTNLATPTIGATASTLASKYFNAIAWTGNGTLPRSITGFGFQPDLIIGDRRDVGYGNFIFDSIRGSKRLTSSSTAAEDTYLRVNSFDADGFTSAGSVDNGNNLNGATYIDWAWKAGGTAVTNTAGSITSQVSANTTSGVSVLTYTGTGANATIGHGLGVAPSMIITKSRSNALDWDVYHSALGPNYWLRLNSPILAVNNSAMWRNISPTSTVFSIGSDTENNTNAATYVAYCFSEVPGFSKFGYYLGNGSTDGPFVYCGFRPKFIMWKNAIDPSATQNGQWTVFDSVRSPYNVAKGYFDFNNTNAENTSYDIVDFLSNGFKLKYAGGGSDNFSGCTYIFMAFAEAPIKYSLGR